jgi:hypothetical protein
MSPTVAVAADTASVALICAFDAGCDPLLGSRTAMSPNQNVNRKRKRIGLAPTSPRLMEPQADATYPPALKARFAAKGAFCAYSRRIQRKFY